MNLSMVRVLKGFERLVLKVLLMRLLNVIFVVYYIFQRDFVSIISFSLAFLYPPWKRQKTSEVSVMKWVKMTPKISINPFIHNIVSMFGHFTTLCMKGFNLKSIFPKMFCKKLLWNILQNLQESAKFAGSRG